MVSMKGAAFVLGGLGLALFASGFVVALTAHPPCASDACPPCPSRFPNQPCWDTKPVTTNMTFLWIGGLILEFAAVVFLYLHFRDTKRRAGRRPGPPRAQAVGTQVSVTQRQAPRRR
ncbi:MAG: hypothetical protein V4510_02875 [bacterium]